MKLGVNKNFKMGVRHHLTTLILFLTLAVGELHTFFPDDVNHKQNWILTVYFPMTVAWNMRYLENEIIPLMCFLAWVFYKDNFSNRLAVKLFLGFSVLNIIMHFFDFKALQNYFKIYVWMAAFWLIAYKWKQITNFISNNLPHPK